MRCQEVICNAIDLYGSVNYYQTHSMNGDIQASKLRFDLSFIDEVDKYIEIYKKQGKVPTVEGFARRIGTDEQSVYAWANKKKKDEQGNITDELARPKFHAAIKRLEESSAHLQEKKDSALNPQQELFCQLYARSREFFGNAVQSYCAAYGIDANDKNANHGARSSAYRLLTNADILKRVDQLLGDLTEEQVDQELAFVIRQNYELPSKVAAIREWNKVKGRIIEKIDHTTKGKELPTPIYNGKSAE